MTKASTIHKRLTELSHKDPTVRRKAARKLGELGDPVVIEPLITALNDENVYVRRHAIAALGNIGAISAFDVLLPLLKDKRPIIRGKTALSLAQISRSHPTYVDSTVYAILRAAEKEKNTWTAHLPYLNALTVMRELAVWPLCIEFNSHRSASSQECVEYALLWLEQEGKLDVSRCLLADQRLTAPQIWNVLEMLTRRRPRNILTPRHLTNAQRFCEVIVGDVRESEATRRGAYAVLDYLSLVRASQSSTAVEASELLRMAYEDSIQSEDGGLLLRGSSPLDSPKTQQIDMQGLEEQQKGKQLQKPEGQTWRHWFQTLTRTIKRLFGKA